MPSFHGTTILCVRRDGKVVMAGDGQVTLDKTVMKSTARKVRRLAEGSVLAGFAGATADAFQLFELFEKKLKEHARSLPRAAVELAKQWRTDRLLRRLEALLVVADKENTLVLSGAGDVIEPDVTPGGGAAAVGSVGPYALAAARALLAGGGPDDVVELTLALAREMLASGDFVLPRADGVMRKVDEQLRQLPEVQSTFYVTGSDLTPDVNKSRIYVNLKERKERDVIQLDSMKQVRDFPDKLRTNVLNRLKVLSGMDITKSRIPQSGFLRKEMGERKIELYVHVMPSLYGETVVVKLQYKQSATLRLAELGMAQKALAQYLRALTKSSGLFLITGPPGSGKRTTVYASILEVHKPDLLLMGFDPIVKYEVPGMIQGKPDDRAEFTFAEGILALMKQGYRAFYARPSYLARRVLAVFGVASLWLAVFADMGVSLLVTANGLRLLQRRG